MPMPSQNRPEHCIPLRRATSTRRLSYIGGLLTLGSVLWLSLSHLFEHQSRITDRGRRIGNRSASPCPGSFILLIILLASLLIIAPDFVYIRDVFGYRINTVFKFYYQAWQLWSLAAAFGTVILLQNLRGIWNAIWRILLGIILMSGLIYPVLAFLNKTNNFNPSPGYSLDAAAHLDRENPDDAAAIRYLQSAPMGVVAEAIGGSYSYYARISTYTGLPTVLGWPWHEYQWRGEWSAHRTREADIKTLYEIPDWEAVHEASLNVIKSAIS